MLRYLKAAFWIRTEIAGVGKLPVNVLALAAFVILGFGHPSFWLLGLGLETAFLFSLAGNRRFQKYVNARKAAGLDEGVAAKRAVLIDSLNAASRAKLTGLESKCERALELCRKAQREEFIVEGNRDALRGLTWLYLKLLTARDNLESRDGLANDDSLKGQVSKLEDELGRENLPSVLRESKTATLKILQKRLQNLERREQLLQEVDSDLTRIEAQVELALENASMQGRPVQISTNIELASHLLDDGVYGESESLVADLEQSFRPTQQVRASG